MCTWPKVTSFDVSPRTKAMINASPLNPPLDARWRNEKPSSKRHLHQTIYFLKPSLAAEHWIHFRYFFVISMKLSGKILLTVRWRIPYLSKHRPKTRTWYSAVWYSYSFHLYKFCMSCLWSSIDLLKTRKWIMLQMNVMNDCFFGQSVIWG